MKKEISENEFIKEFDDYNRSNNFSVLGRQALYSYLCDFEEDTGEEVELDIIALCCGYTEYKDVEEYLKDYGTDEEREDHEETEDFYEAVKEKIQNKTTLIKVDDEAFIIQCY